MGGEAEVQRKLEMSLEDLVGEERRSKPSRNSKERSRDMGLAQLAGKDRHPRRDRHHKAKSRSRSKSRSKSNEGSRRHRRRHHRHGAAEDKAATAPEAGAAATSNPPPGQAPSGAPPPGVHPGQVQMWPHHPGHPGHPPHPFYPHHPYHGMHPMHRGYMPHPYLYPQHMPPRPGYAPHPGPHGAPAPALHPGQPPPAPQAGPLAGAAQVGRQHGFQTRLSNVPPELGAKDLAEAFDSISLGRVVSVDVLRDTSNVATGEAIVIFGSMADAQNAVNRYHGGDLNGRKLQVVFQGEVVHN